MKSFTILCFIFLFSAFVFATRAEELENEASPENEQTSDVAVNDEEEQETSEENDEEETENNEDESEEDEEEDEDEDEEKRSGYRVPCPKKCRKICKPKFCTRRLCKQHKCGYRAVCHKVTRYRIVKRSYKVNVGDLYYPRYIVKYRTSKVPYSVNVCKKVAKYCTRCSVQKHQCGKRCWTVCKKVKCHPKY